MIAFAALAQNEQNQRSKQPQKPHSDIPSGGRGGEGSSMFIFPAHPSPPNTAIHTRLLVGTEGVLAGCSRPGSLNCGFYLNLLEAPGTRHLQRACQQELVQTIVVGTLYSRSRKLCKRQWLLIYEKKGNNRRHQSSAGDLPSGQLCGGSFLWTKQRSQHDRTEQGLLLCLDPVGLGGWVSRWVGRCLLA